MSKPIEPVYRQIAAKLESIRTAIGWTQEDVALKMGLNRTSIVNIEAGKQRIMLHDIEQWARIFQTTPKNLLRGIWF